MLNKIKKTLPGPIKNLLRPIYHFGMSLKIKLKPTSYEDMLDSEVLRFNEEEEVNDLPEIFHYWSNKYLKPKFEQFGFGNPDEFFNLYAAKVIKENPGPLHILSIGSGNCDTEVRLASTLIKSGHVNFTIHCMDINQVMFERGMTVAKKQGVENHLKFLQQDFNTWKAEQQFQLIIANQSLHHVVKLEHLFEQIKKALTNTGYFITSDMIGRNGHMRWPEALNVLKPIWRDMPHRYKFNHAFKRVDKKFKNHDCSTQGFEGIRAQDILPLLQANFKFELFVPFANLVTVFIDRPFGPNFDINITEDLEFIDAIHKLDEKCFYEGTYQPTQMVAALQKNTPLSEPNYCGQMTPEYCIRNN